MPYNFTKLKKSSFGAGKQLNDGEMKINETCITLPKSFFGNDNTKQYVKFDVDTDAQVVRIRKGTEGGSRSFAMSPANHTCKSFSVAHPKSVREVIHRGDLQTGTYKLVEGSKNIFVAQ